jgi:hypothetical protein
MFGVQSGLVPGAQVLSMGLDAGLELVMSKPRGHGGRNALVFRICPSVQQACRLCLRAIACPHDVVL